MAVIYSMQTEENEPLETGDKAMTHKSSFDIQTPDDFFTKVVVPQYKEFLDNNSSARKALIAVIVTYHMWEWAYKNSKATEDHYIQGLFKIAGKITDGTKHFRPKLTTKRQAGFSSAFSDGFARPLVIVNDDKSEISADKLLREMIEHWEREKASGKF